MSPSETQIEWHVPPRDRAKEAELAAAVGVPELIACLLLQRGVTDAEEAHRFLNPSLDDLGAPSLLPDFAAARDIILDAKERKLKVFVHGDYDVDGVSSAAIFDRFLRRIGVDVHTHVPHRIREGYGIHQSAVEAAKAMGAAVFLTCDCGVSAIAQIAAAREAGMTVVVTDHHSLGETLPDAAAIVNPHRKDSQYPHTELSGAGVVFRLCEGIADELGFPVDKYRRAYLDLATLGTVADVMPLVGENRIIAFHGLALLPHTRKVGLQALLRESGVAAKANGTLRSHHIGFQLGPRLNAAGRIDDAALSLELLLTESPERANDLAAQIEAINLKRRAEQERILAEASQRVLDTGANEKFAIVVADEGWHSGVIGIVAGRLVELFRRPAFVGSIDPETGLVKGSARTLPSFHLYDAICAHTHLMSGGGHQMAAGFTAEASRIPEIAEAMDVYARTILTEDDFRVTRYADAAVKPEEITRATVEMLDRLEPFGLANSEPMLVARGMLLNQARETRSAEHALIKLRGVDGPVIDGTAFGLAQRILPLAPGTRLDVLFQPKMDEWQGNVRLKWHLRDFSEA